MDKTAPKITDGFKMSGALCFVLIIWALINYVSIEFFDFQISKPLAIGFALVVVLNFVVRQVFVMLSHLLAKRKVYGARVLEIILNFMVLIILSYLLRVSSIESNAPEGLYMWLIVFVVGSIFNVIIALPRKDEHEFELQDELLGSRYIYLSKQKYNILRGVFIALAAIPLIVMIALR